MGLVQEILFRPADKRNSLETVLIDSFQALGRAVVAPTNELFFLGCTIALERLLIPDGEQTTTERWSIGWQLRFPTILRSETRLFGEPSSFITIGHGSCICHVFGDILRRRAAHGMVGD